MAERTDVRLSEAKICEIVGVSQQQRQQLVARGLLRAAPASGCSLRDTLELAACVLLSEVLELRAARLAWTQLQPALAAAIPGTRLDAVFDLRLGSLGLARSDAELATLVRTGQPVHVIELGPRLQEVGDAFRRWAQVAAHRPRQRRKARDSRAG
jgi:hypothetical protein